MNTSSRTFRSTETPMDFEFTSRPSVKPAWTFTDDAEMSSPRKRPLREVNSPKPSSDITPDNPSVSFGRVQDVPFMLNIPPPQTPQRHPWVPPSGTVVAKSFTQSEIRDVDMAEASPPRPPSDQPQEEHPEEKNERLIATGGLKRVFRSRQRMKEKTKLAVVKARVETEDENSEADSDDETDTHDVPGKTSNHYTLNLPAPVGSSSLAPYVLLGYLQFFFNLSLILVFLYLLIQFILTVQRDVEHRVSEYSMDIVQEIAQCAMQFRTNLCEKNPVPAMVHQCGVWEVCMNRDPTKVGRAKVGAELIAEVVNGFVEPISWKTLAFTLTSLSFLTVFINSLLSLYRSRHNPANVPAHPQPTMPMYPLPRVGPYSHPMVAPAGWGKSWTSPPEVDELPSRRRRLENGTAKEIK